MTAGQRTSAVGQTRAIGRLRERAFRGGRGRSFGAGIARKGREVVRNVVAVVCLSACLGGCFGWDQRYGINPVLDPAAVEASSSNQMRILNALAEDASISQSRSDFYYQVTQAGFNYIDDECRSYFNAIFFLNRDKDQIKAGLTAAGATTAAILGVTGASAKSIAIVAQAFGLGVVGTELVAGTYLYQMPPSVAQGFVKQLQLAYRDGIETRRNVIITPTAAYHAIQDYLSLCLPPTIEAKIAEHVAGAKAFPDPGGNPSFGITTVTAPITRADVKSMTIGNVDQPLSRPPVQASRAGSFQTTFESQLSIQDVKHLQTALCVTADGDLGPLNSETRKAISRYLSTLPPESSPPPPAQAITKRVWSFLVKLINSNRTSC